MEVTGNAYISSFDKKGRYVASIWGHPKYVLAPCIRAWPYHSAEGEFDETWWFNGIDVVRRPNCPATVDDTKLLGVPPASKIIVEGETYDCIGGGEVELTFNLPGTYEVRVLCWPYLDGSYTVENSPQI